MSTAATIELRDWSVVYRRDARDHAVVRCVSLDVCAGRVTALVGESGSGKSTLGLSLLGLLPDNARVTSGSLSIEGRSLRAANEAEWRSVRGRAIAWHAQDSQAALDPLLSIGEQVMEGPLHVEGVAPAAARARAIETLVEVGLSDAEGVFARFPHELSGGMRQRAALAGALATRPRALVADEPTSALDAHLAQRILALLRDTSRARDLALLWITHDLVAAAEYADEIAVMYAGAIVERGPAAQLAQRPLHPYTAALLRSSPARAVRGTRLVPIPGRAPNPDARPSGCAFRDRCSIARASCGEREPALIEVAALRHVACPHHVEVPP